MLCERLMENATPQMSDNSKGNCSLAQGLGNKVASPNAKLYLVYASSSIALRRLDMDLFIHISLLDLR